MHALQTPGSVFLPSPTSQKVPFSRHMFAPPAYSRSPFVSKSGTPYRMVTEDG